MIIPFFSGLITHWSTPSFLLSLYSTSAQWSEFSYLALRYGMRVLFQRQWQEVLLPSLETCNHKESPKFIWFQQETDEAGSFLTADGSQSSTGPISGLRLVFTPRREQALWRDGNQWTPPYSLILLFLKHYPGTRTVGKCVLDCGHVNSILKTVPNLIRGFWFTTKNQSNSKYCQCLSNHFHTNDIKMSKSQL